MNHHGRFGETRRQAERLFAARFDPIIRIFVSTFIGAVHEPRLPPARQRKTARGVEVRYGSVQVACSA